MCVPIHTESCNCSSMCGCVSSLSIEDEIKMLEAGKQRMQVQINGIDRRITDLKNRK